MYSARISATHCCDPLSAATAAFCTIEVGFDVDWLCSFCMALITAAGAKRVAHAPSGHGIGLRKRSDHDDSLALFIATIPPKTRARV